MSAALAKIHIAKKELKLNDDDYRATLLRLVGQESSKGLSDRQAAVVLEEFKRRGWKPQVTTGGKKARKAESPKARPAEHPTARKARALWISLWQLGAVSDASESALEAFAKRQLKCDRLAWADQQQMYKLIEALKAMARREGWSQEIPAGDVAPVLTLMRRLVKAQCRKLGNRHSHIVPGVVMSSIDNADLEILKSLAEGLGRQIRGEG